MNTHIDTLAKWWDGAEEGAARKGDTIIVRYDGDGEYGIRISDADLISHVNDIRILSRAPKPKPAWHDAVAVIAHKVGEYGVTAREVYVSGVDDKWVSACYYAHTSELIDPVPLIEAKVTDEMVKRGRAESMKWDFGGLSTSAVSSMLHAALGIDPSA